MAKDYIRGEVAAVDYHFYINGMIEEAEDYLELIDTLFRAKGTETIYIHLNTPGGSLTTTMQILNAMRASEATVVTIADGEVASAGSLILFTGQHVGVHDFSYVMMHDGSSGNVGKFNENVKAAMFNSQLLRKIYEEVYSPFFSKEEINAVLDGKDMWLTAEEVTERLAKKVEQEEEVDE